MTQPLTQDELAQLRHHVQNYGAELRGWFNVLTDTGTELDEFEAREHVARLRLYLHETAQVLEAWGERLKESNDPRRSASAPD